MSDKGCVILMTCSQLFFTHSVTAQCEGKRGKSVTNLENHILKVTPPPPNPHTFLPHTWMKREMFCTLSSDVRLRGVGEEGSGEEWSVVSISAVTVKVCDVLLLRRSLCEEVTRVSRCPRPY